MVSGSPRSIPQEAFMTLAYYDPGKEVTLQVDASTKGLGAIFYLYGRHFVAESDHKPLASIQMKHLISVASRLQQMLLQLQPYDVKIRYRPGK